MTESDSRDKQGSAPFGALSEDRLRELYRTWSAQLSELHGHERAELEEWLCEYTRWTTDAPSLDQALSCERENHDDPLDPAAAAPGGRGRRKLGLPS